MLFDLLGDSSPRMACEQDLVALDEEDRNDQDVQGGLGR